ncbi:MAG: sugar transferase [Pontibacterium sp.]
MSYSKHKLILQAYRVSDLGAFFCAGLLAAWMSGLYSQDIDFYQVLFMRFSLINLLGCLVFSLIWLLVFRRMKLYAPMRSETTANEEMVIVGWATGIVTLIFFSAGILFDISLFSSTFLLGFWVFSTAMTLLFRRFMSGFLKKVHLGDHNETRIMVIGTGPAAREYVDLIHLNHEMGFTFVGYLADQAADDMKPGEYLGRLDDFKEILQNSVIDEVVITLSIHEFDRALEQVINHASSHGILVRLPMTQLFGNMFGRNVWRLRGEMVSHSGGKASSDLVMSSGHEMGWAYLTKRMFDFCAALILLILASPLMVAADLWIRLTSKGGALFVQDRYGYNGRVFKLYKFRTMIQNADELQESLRKHNERAGAAFKITDDPRVTKAGKFLRKTSIDELPQLFNVLKGDMSLVGPRPLPLADYERFQEVSHMRRLSVLPGITCTWQAGGRNDVSFDEWMQLDMDYIDNWRLSTDLRILLKTVPAVVLGRGAS